MRLKKSYQSNQETDDPWIKSLQEHRIPQSLQESKENRHPNKYYEETEYTHKQKYIKIKIPRLT